MVFDLSKPAVKAIKSPMGGGWVVPLNNDGRRVLTEYYGEPPFPIGPLGGQEGWIVEPQDAGDLAEYLHSEKIAWTVES
jgi:hypothetical protein